MTSEGSSSSTAPSSDDGGSYVVVLRAHSAARFAPEHAWAILLRDPNPDLGVVQVGAFTRWVGEGTQTLPRELVVEVRGSASSLDEALARFSAIARHVATMAAFVANVRVGALEVHLAYEASPEKVEREFLETFIPDERGGITLGRQIRVHLMGPAFTAFVGVTDFSRVDRALRQYELALREWSLGGEWLALSHLWIAAENLTKAAIRKICRDEAISEEDLAHTYDVVTDDPQRSHWLDLVGARVRRAVIFEDDTQTFNAAKKASDGLEHGFLELKEVSAQAVKSCEQTFRHIRRTILWLLALPDSVTSELLEITPLDVQSTRKLLRGRLVGAAENLAAEGELYPLIEWNSAIESLEREGEVFKRNDKERLTIRTHPDVGFELDRLEIIGRLGVGEAPKDLTDKDVSIEYTKAPLAPKLLDAVMPLIDAAAASGADLPYSRPSMFAFHLFGQGVASFQSAQALIRDLQPVEALPSLRTLTIIASRFEQVADENGPGLGVILRMSIDALVEIGFEQRHADMRRQEIVSDAVSAGLTVPDLLPGVNGCSIYRSLGAEMSFAQSIVDGTFGAVGLHITGVEDGTVGFQTKLNPGPLTDLVASACVIAALELLRLAGSLFGWTLDLAAIETLLLEARRLNDESAAGTLPPR